MQSRKFPCSSAGAADHTWGMQKLRARAFAHAVKDGAIFSGQEDERLQCMAAIRFGLRRIWKIEKDVERLFQLSMAFTCLPCLLRYNHWCRQEEYMV